MISIRTHNVLDYVIGAVLIFSPYLLGFATIDAARGVFQFLGVALIVYSLFTKYEYSIAKWIPVNVHMGLDLATGAVLIMAPWAFGYREAITTGHVWAHVILGFGAFALVGFTDRRKYDRAVTGGERDIRRAA